MGKLTADVFSESCCDGGQGANYKSARSCGCDPGIGWVCQVHEVKAAQPEYNPLTETYTFSDGTTVTKKEVYNKAKEEGIYYKLDPKYNQPSDSSTSGDPVEFNQGSPSVGGGVTSVKTESLDRDSVQVSGRPAYKQNLEMPTNPKAEPYSNPGDKEFVIKDSGKRETFSGGMQRDTTEGKIDYTLVLDGPMFKRWAIHLTNGAKKYDKRNWMKADGKVEYDRAKESALRHFLQWYWDERDEDHASAVVFNMNEAEYILSKAR